MMQRTIVQPAMLRRNMSLFSPLSAGQPLMVLPAGVEEKVEADATAISTFPTL
jgi:hypothetical protein